MKFKGRRPPTPFNQLVPIFPDSSKAFLGKGKVTDPENYWVEWYRTHKPENKPSVSDALRHKVALLNANKKFLDIRGVLIGFLKHNSKDAEPWMYCALALAYRMSNGSEADVKTALGYAADMALKSGNPNALVSVADQMFLLKDYDRVGVLLDKAALLVPHRPEPLVMSINLAQKTRDPGRMAASIEALLSLGWPGMDDEGLRRDARKQAETLAKALREDGKADEADSLLDGLPEAEARDLFVRLSWTGEADLDLAVDEPLGATAGYSTPRTVFGGTLINNGRLAHPEEVYVCPRGFDGVYTIHVDVVANDDKKPALQARLEIITHEGTAQEHKEIKTIRLGTKPPAPIKVTLTKGRRTKVLPFLAPTPIEVPVPKKPAQK